MFESISESTQSVVDMAIRLVADAARGVAGIFRPR